MIEQTIATADYPAGTLHECTTSRAGFPIHWWKVPGAPWAVENMNTPGEPITGPQVSGPGIGDNFGAQPAAGPFQVVPVPA